MRPIDELLGRTCRWLAVAILFVPACFALPAAPEVKPGTSPSSPLGEVTAPGRIEPADGIVVVGALPGERLEKLLFAPGDMVQSGEELALLSGHDLRAIEYDTASAQKEEALARIDAQRAVAAATLVEAELGVQQANATGPELEAQEARIEASRANALLARQELDRLVGLEKRLVPVQAIERKRLLALQADLELRTQQAILDKMKLSVGMGRQTSAARLAAATANAKLVEATSSLTALEKAVEAARLRRDLSLVKAAAAGRILEVCMNEGEITGPRPILKMADVSRMHIIAEVDETSIRRIRVGQPVTAEKDKVIDGLTGKVVEIGGVISPEGVQGLGMPMSTEQRIVKVRIEVDDPRQAADLVNLQVDVTFAESASKPVLADAIAP